MAQFEADPIETWVKPSKTTGGQFDFTDCDNLLARDYVQGSKIQLVRNITPSGASAQEIKITDGTETLLINSDGSINVNNVVTSWASVFSESAIIGTVTLGTVPANKRWLIHGYTFISWSAVTSRVLMAGNTVETVTSPATIVKNYSSPLILTAGQTIQKQNVAAASSILAVVYTEESV